MTDQVAAPAAATTEAAPVTDTTAQLGGVQPVVEPTPGAEPAAANEPAAQDTVPEKYEFAMQEGFTANPEVLGEFEGVAKEFGLSQEKAQKLLDLGAKLTQQNQQAQVEAWQKQFQQWNVEARNDKEIGGANYDANLAIANKAYAEFVDKDTQQFLKDMGLVNHPGLQKAFYRAGLKLTPDKMVNGQEPRPAKSAAQVLYPNMTS